MKSIFDLCQPRVDVLEGRLRDEEFAADLSKVVSGKATPEYGDPIRFFRHTHPTRGLRTLLDTVCRRLSGVGGELNSVIRLDTSYGGGKTHSLIALVHAANGMKGVERPEEFVDPAFLPKETVRIAALDGEGADPENGVELEPGLRARSLWGVMAYQLAGREGFKTVRKSDENHVAPGSETIASLFGDSPVLILIDEVSVYLRKAAGAFPGKANQFAPFLQGLAKAVTSSPNAALVTTLAVSASDKQAKDAYKEEHALAMEAFQEAASIVSRTFLQLDPTEQDETVDVLRRRLFESVDAQGATDVVAAYADVWNRNRDHIHPDALTPELREQFEKGYPLHPELLNVMVEKMSSLSTFQRTRGMLRILARTVHLLWKQQPSDAYAIHPHHIDLSNAQIRGELISRLDQSALDTAVGADVAAVHGREPATAQRLDKERFPGQEPAVSYVARTIFLNTLAYGDAAQGIAPDRLRYSVCSPRIEPSFVEQARKCFIEESLYLDDRPGAPMRFRVEPNLNQIVLKAMRDIDADEVNSELKANIRKLFSGKGSGDFELIAFPAGPYEIPDEVGDGRPLLVMLNHDAHALDETPSELPQELVRMATLKGTREETRLLQNNLVFTVADSAYVRNMKDSMRRHIALRKISGGPVMAQLSAHQQEQVKEQFEGSKMGVAQSVCQCYRHLFYPSSAPVGKSAARLGHTAIELQNVSDSPGNGQQHIKRALKNQKKLLSSGDQPDAPAYVRDQTPLKTKGELSTLDLRNEFRRAPNLSILMDDDPLISCIHHGIEGGIFIYREGDQVWGKGDPQPAIQLSPNAFLHTLANATEKNLWPRPAPPEPEPLPGEQGELPSPAGDSSGTPPSPGATPSPAADVPPPAPAKLSAQGPLRQALIELFEKAKSRGIKAFASVDMTLYDQPGISSARQALLVYRGGEVNCRFSGTIGMEGVQNFAVQLEGSLNRADAILKFIDQQSRVATAAQFEAQYTLTFTTPLKVSDQDAFVSAMTKYGGSEAYVEATADTGQEETSHGA